MIVDVFGNEIVLMEGNNMCGVSVWFMLVQLWI